MEKRLLFITAGLGFGGAEKMLVFVANELSRRGNACEIVNLNTAGDYTHASFQSIDESVTVYTVPQPHSGKNNRLYHLREIKRAALDFRADVLVSFLAFPNFYGTIVGKILRIPSVMSERGDPIREKGAESAKGKIVRMVTNWADGGVFQTEGAQKCYRKGLQKRGTVIPNPIFVREETPAVSVSEREKTVVSVGRFDNQQKRYDVMLAAFRLFSEKHPEYLLKLYGAGDDEQLVRSWTAEQGLSDRVRFMGVTSHAMCDIAHDGMFLITSDYEGISNALLEAMAVGLPCVSTDHTPGGARLLITDHENGLLAPIGDAAKLAEAMGEFADDPALSEKCGQNARAVIDRFAPGRIIDLWENYLNLVIKKRHRAGKREHTDE